MSGIFGSLNVANKGLQAAQTALHTTSHNISNANTEGFSRQRVDLKAGLSFTLGGVGQLGTGVKMAGIVRLVDDYVSKQIRQENGTFSKFTAKSDVLQQLEIIYNEPSDTSLNFNLGEMFDAWTELSKNPEMTTAKSIVVEKSKTMTDTLSHIANQLQGLKSDTTELIGMNVKKFNSTVESLDSLNKQIFNISVKGQVPNDLLDQRDVLLKDLSSVIDFTSNFDKNGRVEISVESNDASGTSKVLSFDGSTNLDMIADASTAVVTLQGGVGITSEKGEISGYQDALEEISDQIKELNDFAKTMADAINEAHRTDAYNGDFFTFKDGIVSASNMQVNSEIQTDNNKVNAGKGATPPAGDGSKAMEIAGIRNKNDLGFMKGNNTIEGAYNNMVTNVGISKQQSDNMVANQEVLLDQLVLRRESTSGVSIDEEVTNILKFQSAFEANARVISALSEMLDVLINRTGV